MSEQKIIWASEGYQGIDAWLKDQHIRRLFLVCDQSLPFLRIKNYVNELKERKGFQLVQFSSFQPNPVYESVVEGVKLFHETESEAILAIGGGSALDVAKCIKLYANMDPSRNYLQQEIIPNSIAFLAVPTTAGTGSEATRFAVIYYEGEKQSISHESCIPSAVVMDPSALETLPEYQKKATMLDAFCHAIESYWSVNSTDESKGYSRQAIRLILENMDAYLENNGTANARMLEAAHIAGKAINITQTTAGHAMCYKLTSLYGIAHGHAAALCIARLWPYMLGNLNRCIDKRGEIYLQGIFVELAHAMDCEKAEEAEKKFADIFRRLGLQTPSANQEDYAVLQSSVNPVRLKNNPVALDEQAISQLYHEILNG